MDAFASRRAWAVAAFLALVAATVQRPAQAQPYAYMSQPTGFVTAVDTLAHRIAGNINLGGLPSGIAVTPIGQRAYVANDNGFLSVIDTNAQAEITRVAVPLHAGHVALSADRKTAYVVSQPGVGSVVSVVSTYTNTVIDSISIAQALGQPLVHPSLPRLYIVDGAANVVRVMDTDHDTFGTPIPVGGSPVALATDSAGRRIYVANQASNDVSVIDTATNAVIATFPAGSQPSSVAVNPAATRLFVANRGSNTVTVINLATGTPTTVSVGAQPSGVDVTPDGAYFVVVSAGSATATIFNVDTLIAVALVPVGGAPEAAGDFVGGQTSTPEPAGILSGLWWNPAESGWGVHLTQRRGILFAAWFTYDPAGAPKWYVASSCTMSPPLPCPTCVANAICSGKLYQTQGPRFFIGTFNPGAVQTTQVGLLEIRFQDKDNATMGYTVGNQGRSVQIRRQAFRPSTPAPAVDYTDLWWNPAESGWGMGVTQQDGTMFLTWFVYDNSGFPTWLVASDCVVSPGGNGCSGTLYRTLGPPGPAASLTFDPARVSVSVAGHIDVAFTDRDNGIVTYTVDGVTGAKAITRQLF
jgi:YVTN family beta-propeller protein